MTFGIKLLALLYTAASLFANTAYADMRDIRKLVPAKLHKFEIHDAPKPVVQSTLLD